jgi:hypothetical protein
MKDSSASPFFVILEGNESDVEPRGKSRKLAMSKVGGLKSGRSKNLEVVIGHQFSHQFFTHFSDGFLHFFFWDFVWKLTKIWQTNTNDKK